MRWIAIMAFFLVLTGSALAAGSDGQYLAVYDEIVQADVLLKSGHSKAAALRYIQAQTDLQKFQSDHPTWKPDIVKFRLDYLTDKIHSLAKFLSSTDAPPAVAPAPARPSAVVQPPAVVQPSDAALTQQNAGLQEQVRSLSDANAELQEKLKEAAESEKKLAAANQELELLKAARAEASVQNADLKARAEAMEKKLAAANQELESLKAARAEESAQNADLKARAEAMENRARKELAMAEEAAAESKKIVAAANQELESLKAAHAAEGNTNADLKARAEAMEKNPGRK
jgi:myosin heavy subunit